MFDFRTSKACMCFEACCSSALRRLDLQVEPLKLWGECDVVQHNVFTCSRKFVDMSVFNHVAMNNTNISKQSALLIANVRLSAAAMKKCSRIS